jgi:hypothetical protein
MVGQRWGEGTPGSFPTAARTRDVDIRKRRPRQQTETEVADGSAEFEFRLPEIVKDAPARITGLNQPQDRTATSHVQGRWACDADFSSSGIPPPDDNFLKKNTKASSK